MQESCLYLRTSTLDFMAMQGSNKKIAVLSGKGGTGKTLLAVNLAVVAGAATYIDCDVEEPNGHLFFKPAGIISEEVAVRIPQVDEELCTGCRCCVEFCKFNALAYINKKLLVFEEICHSCGGCTLFCPEKALREIERNIGSVQKGVAGKVKVMSGFLNAGEASGVPIIKKLLASAFAREGCTFIDCPPGSACIVMESIKDADYCILVTEPTLFGVHNLRMVNELVKLFQKPHGAVLNKGIAGENMAEAFCLKNDINIIGKIPFDHHLGTMNSNALIVAEEDQKYRELFAGIWAAVREELKRGNVPVLSSTPEEVQHETALNS